MKGFTFAAVAAFAATSFAAKVELEQTACIQANATDLTTFEVEVDKLTVINLPSVCGLKINSVDDDDVDIKDITCQVYKDAEGKTKGSKEFTSEDPALLGTNPVQVPAILCIGSGDIPEAQPSTFAAVSTSAPVASATGGASPTSGNGTSPTRPSQPTGTNSENQDDPEGDSAASAIGMSFGALSAAAIAMLFL